MIWPRWLNTEASCIEEKHDVSHLRHAQHSSPLYALCLSIRLVKRSEGALALLTSETLEASIHHRQLLPDCNRVAEFLTQAGILRMNFAWSDGSLPGPKRPLLSHHHHRHLLDSQEWLCMHRTAGAVMHNAAGDLHMPCPNAPAALKVPQRQDSLLHEVSEILLHARGSLTASGYTNDTH